MKTSIDIAINVNGIDDTLEKVRELQETLQRAKSLAREIARREYTISTEVTE